jgi:hypothetical protein
MTASHLGRYQIGTELPLCLQCTLARAPDVPSTHPTYEARAADGTVAASGRVAADPLPGVAGLFRGPLFLDDAFAVGRYTVAYRWKDSAAADRVELQTVDVIPGGDSDGAIIALHSVERPDRTSLVYQTDGGVLARGLNPR